MAEDYCSRIWERSDSAAKAKSGAKTGAAGEFLWEDVNRNFKSNASADYFVTLHIREILTSRAYPRATIWSIANAAAAAGADAGAVGAAATAAAFPTS